MDEAMRALYAALCAGETATVLGLLLRNPGWLTARLAGNATPLLVAAYRRNTGLAEELLRLGARLDFIAAVVLGRDGDVRAFLDRDPSVLGKRSPDGWPPLHLAARYAGTEIATDLLDAGADPNGRHRECLLTPLFFASAPPYRNAELLLARGADVNARARHGFTTLHAAAAGGDLGWVEFLLAHGAVPDAQTDARQTPWSIAVRHNQPRIAARLLRA